MGRSERVEYSCDKCGKRLKTCDNSLNIRTELSGYDTNGSSYWSRLHVEIIHRHGMHNDGTDEQADLCKTCAVALLTDALRRVKAGERASAGTEAIEQGTWG